MGLRALQWLPLRISQMSTSSQTVSSILPHNNLVFFPNSYYRKLVDSIYYELSKDPLYFCVSLSIRQACDALWKGSQEMTLRLKPGL